MRARLPMLIFLWSALLAVPAMAQQYNFHTYSELDGLPSSTVLDVDQDKDGVLWLATARGLSRFDGVEWEHFDSFGDLQTSNHLFVGRDNHDRMWTVCIGGPLGISVYEEGRWREIPVPKNEIFEEKIMAYALGHTPDGETFLALGTRHGDLAVFCAGQWRYFVVGTWSVGLGNMAFVEERLAIATLQGLFELNPATWQLSRTSLTKPLRAVCAALDRRGMWVVGDDWIGVGSVGTMHIVAENLSLEFVIPVEGASALADQTGGLYFGDPGQVYFFHPSYGVEVVSRDNGLQSGGVTEFFLDREGHVWVAGLRGLSKLANRSLAGYDSRHGLFDDEVSSILVRRNGQMVLGHFGGLTYLDDPPRTLSFGNANPIRERVIDLAESPAGEVWFAADRLGVGQVKPDGTLEYMNEKDGLSSDVYSLLFDGQGTLWVGTNTTLHRLVGDEFEDVDFSAFVGSSSVLVRRLVEARDGSLLIASGHFGVFRLRDGELTLYTTPRSDRGRNTFCLLEASTGELLVGTVAGLYTVQDGKLVKTSAPWPEIDRSVYSIMEDNRGRIWFGTDYGVMRWDGQEIVHLTNQDGLLGTETNRDALQLGPRDDVWIGTDRGLTVYRAEYDQPNRALPLVSITGLVADGVVLPADEAVRLTAPVQAIDLKFRGVTFQEETRATYLTRLENFEETWHGPDQLPGRIMRYTNVPPGSYTFHVQMKTAQGSLSTVASSAKIVVLPPVTARWWFVLVKAAALLIVLWLFATLISGRRYARRMKTEVRERTIELERSEKNVRDESRRLAATLESISDGVITLDEYDRVVMCNTAAEHMLGRDEPKIQGCELTAVMNATPRISLNAGESTTHALSGDEGRLSWIEVSVAPLVGSAQQSRGTVLAFRDITARREMDTQRARAQQLESLGVLAGGIAQDFNNLLTILLGNILLVEKATEIGPAEQGQLNKMKTATETARALTEQFLTFAKGGDPDLMPTSLGHIIRQAAKRAFTGPTVSCKLDLEPDLWNVEVDRDQIGQVLNNLFLNACQAMDSGGTVLIRGRNTESGGERWVQLEVHDQGAGIAKEDLARIFDPYYTTRERGSGLGLAIAHSIVRRQGGRLSVTSEPGQGSVFTLGLPATTIPVRDGLPLD